MNSDLLNREVRKAAESGASRAAEEVVRDTLRILSDGHTKFNLPLGDGTNPKNRSRVVFRDHTRR
jgi:hypothetical protein